MSAELAAGGVWDRAGDLPSWAVKAVLRPLQIMIAAPSYLFFAALAAMLLRHPDVQFYEIDRVAFVVLVVGVLARAAVLREGSSLEGASWPMLALTLLAMASVWGQAFENETWSLLASKFIVPFTLFHLAGLVFDSEKGFRQFEIFSFIVLAYLSFTAVAFLAGAHWLIFPRFILDESLGFHAMRARGPLLQAVANGVSINLLGLVVLHGYLRKSLRGAKVWIVLASVPIAILATMTRAVWIAFAGSILAMCLVSKNQIFRRRCVAWSVIAVAGLAVVMTATSMGSDISERAEERGPIDYRAAVYAGGWEMFLQRPWMGWGFHQTPEELPLHVSRYEEKVLYPHNTYLELLVEHGVLGLGLYLWLMWELWRLGRASGRPREGAGFLNEQFHRMWPILLAVYWMNAVVVVMSYQFVNGLMFTMAGMLAAQRRRAESGQTC